MELTYEEVRTGLQFLQMYHKRTIFDLPTPKEDAMLKKCEKIAQSHNCYVGEFFTACLEKAEFALWVQNNR